MAFGIPNAAQAAFPAQAAPDAIDIDILVAGIRGTGVITGCAVDEGTSAANMQLTVTAGIMRLAANADVAVGAATATVPTAHATLPRFDLVVVNNTGVVSVAAGTAAASPVFPAVPANNVALAAVYVPAGDTGIANNQIIDKRVTPHVIPTGDPPESAIQANAFKGIGVVRGGAVTAGTGMNVNTSAPLVIVADDGVGGLTAPTYTSNAAITLEAPAGGQERWYLIDNSGGFGTPAGRAGTDAPTGSATPPAVGTAAVYAKVKVPGGATSSASFTIVDLRVYVDDPVYRTRIVNHGTNANVARPAGWGTVIWKGSAVPVGFSTGSDIRINPT